MVAPFSWNMNGTAGLDMARAGGKRWEKEVSSVLYKEGLQESEVFKALGHLDYYGLMKIVLSGRGGALINLFTYFFNCKFY